MKITPALRQRLLNFYNALLQREYEVRHLTLKFELWQGQSIQRFPWSS